MFTANAHKKLREDVSHINDLREIALMVVRSKEDWRWVSPDQIWAGDRYIGQMDSHIAEYIVALHNLSPMIVCIAMEKQ